MNENIHLRIQHVEAGRTLSLCLGFTTHDPASITHTCYATHLHDNLGYWVGAITAYKCSIGSKLSFSVNHNGQIVCSIDGQDERIVYLDTKADHKVDVSKPVWALVDISWDVKAIKIVN